MSACPNCGTESSVLRSDAQSDGTMRRRRKCKKESCQLRFQTVELCEKKLTALQKIAAALSSLKESIIG